jgi:hypothetical protein
VSSLRQYSWVHGPLGCALSGRAGDDCRLGGRLLPSGRATMSYMLRFMYDDA